MAGVIWGVITISFLTEVYCVIDTIRTMRK